MITKTKLTIALKVLVCSVLSYAATTQAADLTISITEVRKDSGKLMLNLMGSEAQMTGSEPADSAMILPPSTDGVRVTLHDLAPGTYGIQVMHDENGNGELDANLLGIPKEPWAFSNNAKGKFGPAKWQDVQFTIGTDAVVQNISLNH